MSCASGSIPPGLDDEAALDALNERGRSLPRLVHGVFTLRLCILGLRTRAFDVEGLMREFASWGARLTD